MKRGSRLWVKSGRGFDDAGDQRVADLANRPTQESPEAVVIGAGPAGLAVAGVPHVNQTSAAIVSPVRR